MRIFQVFLQVAFLPNAAFGKRTDVGDGSGFDTDGSGERRRRGDGDGQDDQMITKCWKWGPPLWPSSDRCGASFGADCPVRCCSEFDYCGVGDEYCLCPSCTDFRVASSSAQSTITEATTTELDWPTECHAKNNVCDEMLCYFSRRACSTMGIQESCNKEWTRCCDDLECSHSEVVAAVSAVYKQYHSQFGHECNFGDTAELISTDIYVRGATKATWVDAVSECKKMGRVLAVPKSLAESLSLHTFMNGDSVWIGLTDTDKEGIWSDTAGQIATYFNWNANEPDSAGNSEHCVESGSGWNQFWNDIDCTRERYYACEQADEVAIICESEDVPDGNLLCPEGSVINVSKAIFGRIDGGSECNGPQTCASSRDVTATAKEACNNKNECILSGQGLNAVYGDPCEMVHKYTRVTFSCQKVCYGLPELADRVIPTLEKTWNLVMHVRPNGVKGVYTNLFDLRRTIAITSDSQLAEEGRLARVMLVEDSTEVSLQFWQNGIKEKVVHSDPLEMNVWSTVEVRQELKSDSKYYFSMWVNGIQLVSLENTQPAIFNNVHVFLGTDGGSLIEPAADICDSWFHTAGNSISLYGKIVGPTTECKAWGDPHITTFDGANNDVFGVTTYVLAQSKETDKSVKKFRVRMVTSKYGSVSRAAKALLDFYDDTRNHVATVETDTNGNANLFTLVNDQWISQPVDNGIMKGAGYRFSFTSIRTKEYREHEKQNDDGEYRTQLTVLTDFKVQVSQIGINIYVTIPKEMYSDKVEGLCGNNDADMENDYQKPDGTVLQFNPQVINSRSHSEYECAKSWIVSETINSRSISNEAGPHPASVSCTDETIIAECDTLLEPSWLSICEPLVSADRRAELVRMCKIDYCMVKEPKTKLDIIMHYVIECQKQSEETILCDWEVQATGQQPVCGSNEEYKGCATMCDLPHCNDYLTNNSCNSKTKTFSSCVCKKDFYLLNGVCVAADACSATGWSDWSHWSSCSNPCGGSRRRLQVCQGSECTTSSQLQEEACSGDCNPCVEAHCHMDATCENNDGAAVCECNAGFDGDGTTCLPQAVAPVFNPCPATDCWTYDTASRTCAMEPACATLSCGATAFDVTFKSALFNLEENQSSVTFAGGLPSPSWDGIQWTTNAPLGLNGMTYNLDAENNEITFSIKLAIVGNDMKTRSDDVQDTLIELGSQSVITTPFGAAVILSCRYSMTIEVASQDYTVDGASVVDTVSATGSLAAGFAMTLNNGDHARFLLGSNMSVGITWSVTGLSSLTFHLQSCTVQHGATIISIVKGGCYAEKLDVLPDSNKQGFSYQVFKGVGETDPNQKISCEVNICEVGQCQIPTANIQCPAAGDELFYSYKI